MFRKYLLGGLTFLLVFLVTLGATFYLTLQQDPVYRSKTTLITKLNDQLSDEKTITTALDMLNRQDDLLGTYSAVAMSQMIKQRAAERLGYAPGEERNLSVSSKVVQGSNILEISVNGKNREQVQQFTNAVGEETIHYINALYPTYRMELLDSAGWPANPVSPNLPLNMVLGAALGAFLGIGVLLLASWIRGSLRVPQPAPEPELEPEVLTPARKEPALLPKEARPILNDQVITRTTLRIRSRANHSQT